MKRIIWLIGGLLICLTSYAKVNVSWLNREVNLGLINESDGPRQGIFTFINKGRKAIQITEVKPACGCTEVSFTQGKIAKGDTAHIYVTFNPEQRPGKFDKGIYVTLNNENIPENLRIEGTVMASPETLKLFYRYGDGVLRFDKENPDFGEMKRGLKRRGLVEIYNTGLKPITPEISSDSRALTFELNPAEIKPGESSTLTIYLNSSLIMWLGDKEVPMKVKTDNDEQELTLKVKLLP